MLVLNIIQANNFYMVDPGKRKEKKKKTFQMGKFFRPSISRLASVPMENHTAQQQETTA